MPGTPDPVLGSDALTFAIACAAGALAASVPYALRERVPAPLGGLFGATVLVLSVFLRVGGESDPLAIYPFFGTAVVAGLCVLALVEAGVRRFVLVGA